MFPNKIYTSDLISQVLLSKKPAMIARLGSTEMMCMSFPQLLEFEDWGAVYMVNNMVDALKDECKFDDSKPSAIPQKLLDVAKLSNIGWKVTVGLDARESLIRRAGQSQKIKDNAI